MLINNKSLIKTINKLNLTDDEREKFNKISEDDNGNFLYNGKPVIGGATAEQVAQIQANKTAIGDSNSGLIKEVNDIKNTELQNLNIAIQTVNETIGNKSELPVGDANIIASINRIDNKQFDTVTDEQVSTAVNNYLTEHPVTSGATEEQANQIQANTNAIGNESSGLIKDINDVKARINYNCTLKEYNNRDEMINDTTLKEGDVCRTLGFYTPFDKGGAEYIITSENTKPTPGADGDLNNGLKFKYIIKDRRINIKACGIKERDKANVTANSAILRELLLRFGGHDNMENDSVGVIYFPQGKYFLNNIYFTNEDDATIGINHLHIHLEGMQLEQNRIIGGNVIINTLGGDFIVDKRNDRNSSGIVFYLNNLTIEGLEGGMLESERVKMNNICIGRTTNNGNECNYRLYNTAIHCFKWGVLNPGYACDNSGGYNVDISCCVHGIWNEDVTHTFHLENVMFNYCVWGIKVISGDPCRIKNVHIATGYYGAEKEDYDTYYGITTANAEIDGIYYENYGTNNGSEKNVILNIEGSGQGGRPCVVKNYNPGNIIPNQVKEAVRVRTYYGYNTPSRKEFNPTIQTPESYDLTRYRNGILHFDKSCCISPTRLSKLINRKDTDFANNMLYGRGITAEAIPNMDRVYDGSSIGDHVLYGFNSKITSPSYANSGKIFTPLNCYVLPITNLESTDYYGQDFKNIMSINGYIDTGDKCGGFNSTRVYGYIEVDEFTPEEIPENGIELGILFDGGIDSENGDGVHNAKLYELINIDRNTIFRHGKYVKKFDMYIDFKELVWLIFYTFYTREKYSSSIFSHFKFSFNGIGYHKNAQQFYEGNYDNPSEEVKEYNAVYPTAFDSGNDTIEMILSSGKQLYTINYTPSDANKVNIADIVIEDTTIVGVAVSKAKKGYVEIAITPKIVGETYITLTNKFKPEVTKRIQVIVRSE